MIELQRINQTRSCARCYERPFKFDHVRGGGHATGSSRLRPCIHLYINLACLSVCLYPINVKTAEPIRPKFFVGHHVIPRKVYGWSNFQKFASIKIRFLKNLKIHEIFFENPRNFFLLFVNKEKPCVFYFYKWNKI